MEGILLPLCCSFPTCLTPFLKGKEQGNFINQHAKPEKLLFHQVCPYSHKDHAHLQKGFREFGQKGIPTRHTAVQQPLALNMGINYITVLEI